MSPKPNEYLNSFLQIVKGERVAFESRAAAQRSHDLEPYLSLLPPLRILDLANGRLQPQYLLLTAEGHQVYGLDLVNHPPKALIDHVYQLARRIYKYHIPNKKWLKEDKLVCGDVGYLPFTNDSFDLVTSMAAFEHFLDVPRVVSELRRVIRPRGLGWIAIHPFTCPSGGHNITSTELPLVRIPPGVDALGLSAPAKASFQRSIE
jgi:SAM-dependent methyltransferase